MEQSELIQEQLTSIQSSLKHLEKEYNEPVPSNNWMESLIQVITLQATTIANLTSLLSQVSAFPNYSDLPVEDFNYDASDAGEISRSGREITMNPLELNDEDVNTLTDLGVDLV